MEPSPGDLHDSGRSGASAPTSTSGGAGRGPPRPAFSSLGAMAVRSRDGLGRYMLMAVVASAAVLAAQLGARSPWAGGMLRDYVP